MIFANLLIYILPIRFLAIAILYKIRAGEKINEVSGYRSKLSTKSKENWKFANNYASRLLFIFTTVFLLINIVIQVKTKVTLDFSFVLVSIQVLTYIFTRIEVNRSLKNFDLKKKD